MCTRDPCLLTCSLLTCSLQNNELWPWKSLALVPMTEAPSITKRGPSRPFEPSASCPLTPWRTESSHHSPVHSWTTSFPCLLPFDWQSENSWFATWSMGFFTMACRWAFHIKCGTYSFLLMVCLGFLLMLFGKQRLQICDYLGSRTTCLALVSVFCCYFTYNVGVKLIGNCQIEAKFSIFSEDEGCGGWWGWCSLL